MNKNDRLLFSLFRIGVSIQHLNKKSERKVGLSLVQWCLLEQLIDMPGTSAYALAKSVGVHPSTLTQTLKRLEKKGHVFLTEDPRDSRKKLISLTKIGKQAMEKVQKQMNSWSDELSSFRNDLKRLNSFLQNQVNDSSGEIKITGGAVIRSVTQQNR